VVISVPSHAYPTSGERQRHGQSQFDPWRRRTCSYSTPAAGTSQYHPWRTDASRGDRGHRQCQPGARSGHGPIGCAGQCLAALALAGSFEVGRRHLCAISSGLKTGALERWPGRWLQGIDVTRVICVAWELELIAVASVVISVLAFGFSLFAFIESRQKDRRDLFLTIHQLLIGEELRRGRQILFQKITDEDSVRRLSDGEYRDINRAVSTYNTLGMYVAKHYVREQDVMDIWAQPIFRAWRTAQPYIKHRERLEGYKEGYSKPLGNRVIKTGVSP